MKVSRSTSRWLFILALVVIACCAATGAWAQATQATKAAVDASTALIDKGVLGAACVLLALAASALLWLLLKSYDRYAALLERVVQAMEGSKDGSDGVKSALTELRSLLAENRGTVGELGHQMSILVEKVQHGFANVTQAQEGFARLIERERERQQDRERQALERQQDRDRGRT